MTTPAFLPSRRWTKKHLWLAAGLAAALAGLAFLAVQAGVIGAIDSVVLGLRDAGPLAFFVAMALLPAVGFPMMAFTLAAGPVFGPSLGAGWVITWCLLAVLANLLISYWLAGRALRPLVGRLLTRFDCHLPENAAGDAWQVTLITRLTPGPPYWVQNYLLGLLRVPLVPYLVVSLLVMAGYLVALVLGGTAASEGNGRLGFAAVGILVVFVAALQVVRKRAARRAAARLVPAAR